MTRVHEKYINAASSGGEPLKKFDYSRLTQVAVCSDSGLLPSDACGHDLRGSRVSYGWFAKSQIPTKTCGTHMLVDWDSTTARVATPYCPASAVMKVALIKVEDRNFVQNIPITDARYTCRAEAGNPANVINPSDPYYLTAMPAGTYAGYSPGVDAPQNSYCNIHNAVYPIMDDDPDSMDGDFEFDDEFGLEQTQPDTEKKDEKHESDTSHSSSADSANAENSDTASNSGTTGHPLH